MRISRWLDKAAPYLFISPFILAFLCFFIGPALYAFVLSFYRYKGFGTATWVGLSNYETILRYHIFWKELGNTVFYWIAHTVPMMVIAFLLALLVHVKSVRYKRFFKPVIFVPQLVAGVAAALVFRNFFGTNYGVFNTLLGLEIPWLEEMSSARWAVVILLVWRGVGYWFVIYLAGFTSIGEEVMDAATVDGVNSWQRLVHITMPLMQRTFLFALVVDGIFSLRMFAEPNVLAGRVGGELAPVGMAPVLNLLILGIRNARFGQAAAVGWLLFMIIAGITALQMRLMSHRETEQ